ncbi:MAG: ferrous iron transport protein A [Oscillospiraceae bacterium]|jgi:Fe2+ transport system protein FeoA|nr:ferrous iron transport protein A [Oscillospiraceae bacterium]
MVNRHTGARNLGELLPGQTGVIVSIGGEGAIKRRLVDMGLTPGARVTLRKTAPLGDPLEINLRDYELSLRREDARKILLEERDPDENSAYR